MPNLGSLNFSTIAIVPKYERAAIRRSNFGSRSLNTLAAVAHHSSCFSVCHHAVKYIRFCPPNIYFRSTPKLFVSLLQPSFKQLIASLSHAKIKYSGDLNSKHSSSKLIWIANFYLFGIQMVANWMVWTIQYCISWPTNGCSSYTHISYHNKAMA